MSLKSTPTLICPSLVCAYCSSMIHSAVSAWTATKSFALGIVQDSAIQPLSEYQSQYKSLRLNLQLGVRWECPSLSWAVCLKGPAKNLNSLYDRRVFAKYCCHIHRNHQPRSQPPSHQESRKAVSPELYVRTSVSSICSSLVEQGTKVTLTSFNAAPCSCNRDRRRCLLRQILTTVSPDVPPPTIWEQSLANDIDGKSWACLPRSRMLHPCRLAQRQFLTISSYLPTDKSLTVTGQPSWVRRLKLQARFERAWWATRLMFGRIKKSWTERLEWNRAWKTQMRPPEDGGSTALFVISSDCDMLAMSAHAMNRSICTTWHPYRSVLAPVSVPLTPWWSLLIVQMHRILNIGHSSRQALVPIGQRAVLTGIASVVPAACLPGDYLVTKACSKLVRLPVWHCGDPC